MPKTKEKVVKKRKIALERQTKLRLERAVRRTIRKNEKKMDKLYERLYMK